MMATPGARGQWQACQSTMAIVPTGRERARTRADAVPAGNGRGRRGSNGYNLPPLPVADTIRKQAGVTPQHPF